MAACLIWSLRLARQGPWCNARKIKLPTAYSPLRQPQAFFLSRRPAMTASSARRSIRRPVASAEISASGIQVQGKPKAVRQDVGAIPARAPQRRYHIPHSCVQTRPYGREKLSYIYIMHSSNTLRPGTGKMSLIYEQALTAADCIC